MKSRMILSVSVLLAASCLGAAPGWEVFGSEFGSGETIPVSELFRNPETWDGKTVRVEGTVAAVCQKKGCWITMHEGGQNIRVRFKDYAFFLPKDCSGRTAHIEGVFSVKQISIEEARHYLEDAGRGEEAAEITEPTRQLTLLASGVRLKR